MKAENLARFDAVVLGIRAYNTQDRIEDLQTELLAYVKAGGTVVAQYNTTADLKTKNIGPYPLEFARDRVTDENAEVRILAPDHPLMNTPNKITAADFNGWVQERGLYFPNKWDPRWTPILSCHDPGEPPLDGGLLVAKSGKGYFIYTGYSWFRQLPAEFRALIVYSRTWFRCTRKMNEQDKARFSDPGGALIFLRSHFSPLKSRCSTFSRFAFRESSRLLRPHRDDSGDPALRSLAHARSRKS